MLKANTEYINGGGMGGGVTNGVCDQVIFSIRRTSVREEE